MARAGENDRLTDDEFADLDDRVDRFHAAWTPAGTTDPEPFLPPPGARHRRHVLLELLKTDMERRAKAGLEVRIDSYLDRYPGELSRDPPPVSLVAEEFRLRYLHGDKPGLDEYRRRFPAVAEALIEHVRRMSLPVSPVRGGTIGIDRSDAGGSGDVVPPARQSPVPRGSSRRRPGDSGRNLPSHDPDPVDPADVLPAELEYKLVRKLGKGAFGEVFEAVAPGGFRVAVKRILRNLDHPASQGEIESLEAIKAINHPFLVQTHGYWVLQDRLVIVMELADGSLADRIKYHTARGLVGVPPGELIPYFEQAAEALDYLHSQHVSHRDVKPENLLFLKGYAKVADFGLAREHRHTMTEIDMMVGTPVFMAPEVWSQEVSLHSDQYSLAVTYVMARIGRPPFDGKLMPRLCLQHTHEAPDLGGIPPAEQQVLRKALAKKPAERYPSCRAFTRALRHAVLDPPPRSRRVVAVIAAAVILACAGTAAVVARLMPPALPAPTEVTKDPPWCPGGWAPVAADGTAAPTGGPEWYNRLTRTEAGEELTAVLVLPTRQGDPPPFYVLRNKVSNRVFREVWERAEADPKSRLRWFRAVHPTAAGGLLPGRWRRGATDHTGRELGTDGEQARLPVVGVTAPEAMLVAAELGGLLPTYRQWQKAAGATGDAPPPGPAGDKEKPGEDLTRRPLALGLGGGPWPVDRETRDVSVHGVHQLVSNGYEWTDGPDEGGRVNLADLPALPPTLRVTGETWEIGQVQTFDRIADQRKVLPWNETAELVGFRIVLVPR